MHTKNTKLEKLGITISNCLVCPVPPSENQSTYLTTPFNQMRSKFSAEDSISAPPPKWISLVSQQTAEFLRQMRLQEFFQDVSSEPNKTTNELDQSTKRSNRERTKESLNWTPPEGHCVGLDRYAQAIRERVNARFISCTQDAILQLIHFIFDNQFFSQTHGTAMGTNFSPQYANIFMHRFKQDFFAAQDLRPTPHTRRQTQDTSDGVPFVVQYIPGVEKLRHVLRSLRHIINDDEHLAKIFLTPPLLAFKQLQDLKQTTVHSKLPSLQDNI
eukprot:g36130.t1